jgi:hypothetical protein
MTVVTEASEPCGCGCQCCDDRPRGRDREVAELRALREAVAKRLAELGETG